VRKYAIALAVLLMASACSGSSDSTELQALRERVAELEQGVDVAPSSSVTERLETQTTDPPSSSEIERLEAEVDDLRDRLEEAGLVEPTVTLGVDPPPSDELIGFWKGGEIFVMDPYGRHARQVTSHSDPYQPDLLSVPKWSPDGTRIVYVLNRDLRVINTDGSGGYWLGATQSCGMARVPSWSPDGERVLFSCGSSDIYVVDVDGTNLRQLTQQSADNAIDQFDNWDASWSPDGRYIAYRESFRPHLEDWSESIVFINFPEGEKVDRSISFPWTMSGHGRPLTWGPQETLCPSTCAFPIAYVTSKDGGSPQIFTEYFYADSNIKGLVGTGYEPTFNQYTYSQVGNGTPVWSSNGNFAYVNETVDGPEIFVDFAGHIRGRPRQLTDNLVRDGNPVWSPDGTKIAHTSDRDSDRPNDIYLMDAGKDCIVESMNNEPCDLGGGNILSTGQSGTPWGWISTG